MRVAQKCADARGETTPKARAAILQMRHAACAACLERFSALHNGSTVTKSKGEDWSHPRAWLSNRICGYESPLSGASDFPETGPSAVEGMI